MSSVISLDCLELIFAAEYFRNISILGERKIREKGWIPGKAWWITPHMSQVVPVPSRQNQISNFFSRYLKQNGDNVEEEIPWFSSIFLYPPFFFYSEELWQNWYVCFLDNKILSCPILHRFWFHLIYKKGKKEIKDGIEITKRFLT